MEPLTMAGLGVLLFRYLVVDFIELADADQLIAGLILVGAAARDEIESRVEILYKSLSPGNVAT